VTWREDMSQLLTAVLGLAARDTSKANSRLAASCRTLIVSSEFRIYPQFRFVQKFETRRRDTSNSSLAASCRTLIGSLVFWGSYSASGSGPALAAAASRAQCPFMPVRYVPNLQVVTSV